MVDENLEISQYIAVKFSLSKIIVLLFKYMVGEEDQFKLTPSYDFGACSIWGYYSICIIDKTVV